jgi:beta-glucosidase
MKKVFSFLCMGIFLSPIFAQNNLPQLGKDSISQVIAAMTTEEKASLVVGIGRNTWSNPEGDKTVFVPGAAGCTFKISRLGITPAVLPDGPAGLRINPTREGDSKKYYCTAFPTATALASTWNTQLVEEVGKAMGNEVLEYGADVLLAPAINLQRNPLCGRDFEYYSEDPLITGKMGAAVTIGVQTTPGSCVSIKHFACNNQEEDRGTSNSTVSERALREIYLRGFEICVREAKPKTVMSSYNKLNGVHTSSHYELLTEVLRGEWGFDGLVMTDWNSQSTKPFDLHAGNDLIMGGYRSQILLAALNGSAPEFGLDGYVREEVFKVYGGFFKETVQYWNSFELDANGPDTVSVSVKPNGKLNDKINSLMKDGIAAIEQQPDGGKKVIYHGINRGAYLSLGDVQKSVAAVLRLHSEQK